MKKVLFVCLGNICRSPTAEGVFRALVREAGRGDEFEIDSAGTGDWHLGEAPDGRAQAASRRAGIDISMLRARRVRREDFAHYDRILACDAQNRADLLAQCPDEYKDRVQLLMSFAEGTDETDVPDPYYGSDKDFDATVARCRAACEGLLNAL